MFPWNRSDAAGTAVSVVATSVLDLGVDVGVCA